MISVGGIGRAFHSAAGELGMLTTSRLIVDEVFAAAGEPGIVELRATLGRRYAVLDAVAAARLAGSPTPAPGPEAVATALRGATSLLVVGVEADALDALLPLLGGTRLGVLAVSELEVDWARCAASYGAATEVVPAADWARWAGRRAALLTFLYGRRGAATFVVPAWLRVSGPDVRTLFRTVLGWDVLGRPPDVYPRWLAETTVRDFSTVVGDA
ncbi:MAG: hypothetical protein JNM10_02335 [Planctomycetia bacterium]|nr:hypothetical protein [Planctomycetia bacterium]